MIIYQKLSDIDKNSRQTFLKSTTPSFQFKKNQRETYIKNGIKALAQENLFMLKKLINQESEYKRDKFEQQYQESRRYKNNICHYPSINFNRTKISTSSPLVQSYDFNHKKYRILNTEGKLPKLKNYKKNHNFMSLQTKYAMRDRELDPHYFKEAKRTNRKNNFNKSKVTDKKSINSVTEKDDEDSSSNKKINEEESDSEKKSGSKSGSESGNDEDKSGSGSGGSD